MEATEFTATTATTTPPQHHNTTTPTHPLTHPTTQITQTRMFVGVEVDVAAEGDVAVEGNVAVKVDAPGEAGGSSGHGDIAGGVGEVDVKSR